LSLPDQELHVDVPVIGHVTLDLSNIKITGFHIPSASIGLAPPSAVTGLQVAMDFHWRKDHWPHISDHGDH
jgi:hypothetical protein